MSWHPKGSLSWLRLSRAPSCHHTLKLSRFYSISSNPSPLPSIPRLTSWDLDQFRQKAFRPCLPHLLPVQNNKLPSACTKWFIHDAEPSFDLRDGPPTSSELCSSFWSAYEDTLVPLELTSSSSSTFHRTEAPLKILLAYLGRSPIIDAVDHAIYLAQCSLTSLPPSIQADVPTPSLVLNAGKGDVYESSLWLGRPPTYTPLHRDPNPNLFLQLAGRKKIRLLPPEVGLGIFEKVQDQLREQSESSIGSQTSSAFRGEEMMAGPERELLHRAIWEDDAAAWQSWIRTYGQEAEVSLGEALFIPKGWWHSIKGVGEGITASANWWFR